MLGIVLHGLPAHAPQGAQVSRPFVVQRTSDKAYFNGFRTKPWSPLVSSAMAFATREEAVLAIKESGFRLAACLFLPLPMTRRSPLAFAKTRAN